jgi:SpoVK/Ycf46/Vps4 family AAA+-type ATPase
MSANLRIIKQVANAASELQRQVPELVKVVEAFIRRAKEQEARKEATPEGRAFLYNVSDLEKDISGLLLERLHVFYKGKKPPQVVGVFVQTTYSALKTRIEGINACPAPESVKEWNLANLAGLEIEKQAITDGWINRKLYPSLYKGRVRGILMYGPPGTGKTVLGKAMSNSLPGTAFFNVDASSIKSKWHGETEKAIAGRFDCAADLVENSTSGYTSAIVFLDEIDAIGGKRTADGGGGSSNSTPALLVAMDGFFSSPNVAVVAATNVPWNLDGGLLRRFDESIFVDLPSLRARIGIILDAIVKHFYPPWMTIKPEHSWSDPKYTTGDLSAMTSTRDFGEASRITWSAINKYASKAVVGPNQQAQKVLTESTLRSIVIDIAKRTGPQTASKDKMKHRTGEDEFSDTAHSKYGFNSSDITNMVKKAATLSLRKLFMPRYYGSGWVYMTEEGVNYAVSAFYVGDVDDMSDTLPMSSLGPIHPIEDARSPARGGPGATRMLNFTITHEDFLAAINEVGSSVNTEDYEQVLAWKSSAK